MLEVATLHQPETAAEPDTSSRLHCELELSCARCSAPAHCEPQLGTAPSCGAACFTTEAQQTSNLAIYSWMAAASGDTDFECQVAHALPFPGREQTPRRLAD